jgi:hypothetical protein
LSYLRLRVLIVRTISLHCEQIELQTHTNNAKKNHGCSQNRTHERIGKERDRFVVEGLKN